MLALVLMASSGKYVASNVHDVQSGQFHVLIAVQQVTHMYTKRVINKYCCDGKSFSN